MLLCIERKSIFWRMEMIKINSVVYNFLFGMVLVVIFLSCASRPQTPKKPYPYYEEEVVFNNPTAGITLAGTLTLPNINGSYPAVVLIAGSGPNERDEVVEKHKIFMVLADYLTKNGIAVLRFDKRGTGKSTGEFGTTKRYGIFYQDIPTATAADFASDVEAAVSFLKTRKEVNKEKIGLIGHSEGGLIAPLVASKLDDVAFIVLLAAPGIPMDQLNLTQNEWALLNDNINKADIQMLLSIDEKTFDLVNKATTDEQLRQNVTKHIEQEFYENPRVTRLLGKPIIMSKRQYTKAYINEIISPWNVYILGIDPSVALKEVKCPVLAINGDKDVQVSSEPNLSAIQNALTEGCNNDFTIMEMIGINHLLQECITGSPKEYAKIKQTISPLVLEEIARWIKIRI